SHRLRSRGGIVMATNAGVRTELYRDQFGVLLEDLSHRLLELKWLEGSSGMTDEDFKSWLDRFSVEAEARRLPYLVINLRAFRHRPGPAVGPEGSPGAASSPAPEPPGNFATGYLDAPSNIGA